MSEDKKLPSEQDELEQLFLLWKCWVRNQISTNEHVLISFKEWKNEENVKAILYVMLVNTEIFGTIIFYLI